MERGTERERTAVRDRWAAMERRRARTTALLGGLSLAGAGTVVLALVAAGGVCETTLRGHVLGCSPLAAERSAVLLAVLGGLSLGIGLARCWRAVRA
ncbi:hypothetical protein [Haloarcula litorea]|uniref:hypothetical protein n=1 Tax=Haloarcula litorea TaxID=3032579 RepID=UPI0023E80D22|nr:hypothetical protein [Halomicroarcula sp. GDY20]